MSIRVVEGLQTHASRVVCCRCYGLWFNGITYNLPPAKLVKSTVSKHSLRRLQPLADRYLNMNQSIWVLGLFGRIPESDPVRIRIQFFRRRFLALGLLRFIDIRGVCNSYTVCVCMFLVSFRKKYLLPMLR